MMIRTTAMAALAGALFLGAVAPVHALDRRVRIVNETGFTIVRFFGSNTGTDEWQEDILGDDVLPSGSAVIINFDDGTGYCKYDLRAVFDDGDVVTQTDVNICEIGTFTFN